MRRPSAAIAAAAVGVALFFASVAHAGQVAVPPFGQPVTSKEIAGEYSVAPDGAGLPAGQGTVEQGREIYAHRCAACHGAHLEGNKAIGAPALVGGRGTLASAKPVKTVESYWPYATTLFDYIRRAMPFDAPGSLTPDEVYGVTAYVLSQSHVIDADATLDAKQLAAVRMPNAHGFIPDPR